MRLFPGLRHASICRLLRFDSHFYILLGDGSSPRLRYLTRSSSADCLRPLASHNGGNRNESKSLWIKGGCEVNSPVVIGTSFLSYKPWYMIVVCFELDYYMIRIWPHSPGIQQRRKIPSHKQNTVFPTIARANYRHTNTTQYRRHPTNHSLENPPISSPEN